MPKLLVPASPAVVNAIRGQALAEVRARRESGKAELYDWTQHARPSQLPPDWEWGVWAIITGRGWGKTRTGAEWVRREIEERGRRRIALVAETAADARDVMVEGESGIMAIGPPWNRPIYEPSKRRVTWPNGAIAITYSADKPDQVRGPQHDGAWCLEGETLIAMADGSHERIEAIRAGDFVATIYGPRPVRAAECTRRDAELWQITTTEGPELVGTPDHLVFADGTFKPLCDVRPGAIMRAWMERSYLRASASGLTDATTSAIAVASSCTVLSGRRFAARFRKAISSTTRTAINWITGSRTWSAYPVLFTPQPTGGWVGPSGIRLNDQLQPSGYGRRLTLYRAFVRDAVASIRHGAPIADGVAANAERLPAITVMSVERLNRRADVYDIAVEGAAHFFASGLLVHNCDEVGKWRRGRETWDNMLMGVRQKITPEPQVVVTSTPRETSFARGVQATGPEVIKELLKNEDSLFALTRGSTYENLDNLSLMFRRTVVKRYEGTRIGRQELEGELLEDVPGALWHLADIDAMRIRKDDVPDLDRVVVAIDPSGGSSSDSDEVGIVVAGKGMCSCKGEAEEHGFILDDISGRLSPLEWARRAVAAYKWHRADRIIAERNFGGDMVEQTIRSVDQSVSYKGVVASRGKAVRAEPIAALYEPRQAIIHHVGILPELEDQLCGWVPGMRSPDRLDALVWALDDLMLSSGTLVVRFV